MRNILIMVIVVILSCPAAFAEGLSGWAGVDYGSNESKVDGSVVQSSDSFTRNAYFQLERPVTPLISYRLYLRALYADTDLTDENGEMTKRYRSSIEPAGDIFLRNPVYSGSAGFRHQENWQTARFQGDNFTTDHYYTRLGLTPYQLPSLFFDYDRKEDRNDIPGQEMEVTNERYSGSSSYKIVYGGMTADYNVNYSRLVEDTPLNVVERAETDQRSAQYKIGYVGSALENSARYQASYKANYLEQDRTSFLQPSSVSQDIIVQRTALDGLIAQGSFVQQEVTPLNSLGALIDGNTASGIPAINLGTQSYYNIGVQVVPGKTVDRLYLYVDHDVSSDVNLGNTVNWRVFVSDSNTASAVWTTIPIARVDVKAMDVFNDIYRYELIFDAPQNTPFYKAVNLATVNVLGVSDVLVTEIEAWGTDVLPPDRVSTEESGFFRQEFALHGNLRLGRVILSGAYNLMQDDTNPGALSRSMGNIVENVFSKSFYNGGDDFRSAVERNYSISASWLAHQYLTTDIRYYRRERYDSDDKTDEWSNTYELSFQSVPLPTLNTDLTLTYRDTFSFGDRSITEKSAIATVGTGLFKDVNLVTDLGYRTLELRVTDTTTEDYFINGTLNAVLTPRLSTYVIYGFDWATKNGNSLETSSQSLILTYQPGKFIIISANVRNADSEGAKSLSEGIFVDWLPVRAIRLTANYDHSDTDPGNVQRDSTTGSVTWFISRYFDFRVVSGYVRQRAEQNTEQVNFLLSLNLRL